MNYCASIKITGGVSADILTRRVTVCRMTFLSSSKLFFKSRGELMYSFLEGLRIFKTRSLFLTIFLFAWFFFNYCSKKSVQNSISRKCNEINSHNNQVTVCTMIKNHISRKTHTVLLWTLASPKVEKWKQICPDAF